MALVVLIFSEGFGFIDSGFVKTCDKFVIGITMWEIYDGRDRRPYYKYNNDKVREIILDGVTLDTPEEKFPPRIKAIMELCWKTKSQRPVFKDLFLDLEKVKNNEPFSEKTIESMKHNHTIKIENDSSRLTRRDENRWIKKLFASRKMRWIILVASLLLIGLGSSLIYYFTGKNTYCKVMSISASY